MKDTKSMGVLKHTWKAREVMLASKIKFYEAKLVNVLLWGSKNWSINKNDITMIEAFYNKAMYRIFKVPMSRVKEDKIKSNH